MRTRTWIILLSALALVLLAVVLAQSLSAQPARTALVYSDGTLVATLELDRDEELRVEYKDGYNLLRVENGSVRVAEATCPDGDCLRQGAKNSGTPIICLPNRLTVRFADGAGLDGVTR